MEYMPELIAEEEPLTQGNTTVTAAIETSVQLPALTVSLNTSMMEGGANHQPIITTEVHPPPRYIFLLVLDDGVSNEIVL